MKLQSLKYGKILCAHKQYFHAQLQLATNKAVIKDVLKYLTDWEANCTAYCDEFWKGWNSRILETNTVQVKDIGKYCMSFV